MKKTIDIQTFKKLLDEARAIRLPEPKKLPNTGRTPRYLHSYEKGRSWCREVSSEEAITWEKGKPEEALLDSDRKEIEKSILNARNLGIVESRIRGGLTYRIRPAAIRKSEQLGTKANEKLKEALTTDQRAFWTGVKAYDAQVRGWASTKEDPARLNELLDEIEAWAVKLWMRNRKSNV